MFKRDVIQIKDLILRNLRAQGLETPLLQKRLMDAWPTVMGETIHCLVHREPLHP